MSGSGDVGFFGRWMEEMKVCLLFALKRPTVRDLMLRRYSLENDGERSEPASRKRQIYHSPSGSCTSNMSPDARCTPLGPLPSSLGLSRWQRIRLFEEAQARLHVGLACHRRASHMQDRLIVSFRPQSKPSIFGIANPGFRRARCCEILQHNGDSASRMTGLNKGTTSHVLVIRTSDAM